MARRVTVDLSDLIAHRQKLLDLLDYTVLEVSQKITLDVGKELIEASPVDTGEFRGAWEIKTPSKPYEGGSVSNAKPYAGKLARGHSPQADDGWIDNAIKAAVRFFTGGKK